MSSARHRRPPEPVLTPQRVALGALAATGAGAALPLLTAPAPAVAATPSSVTSAAPARPLPGHPAPAPDAPSATGTHVVRTGENLSEIAQALCQRGGWPALYQRNQAVVGPDPDLIRPGERLRIAMPRCATSPPAPPIRPTPIPPTTPTTSPVPTSAPTPTSTPIPTSTPTPTSAPTPTSTPTPTSAPTAPPKPTQPPKPTPPPKPAPAAAAIWYTAADGSRRSTTVLPSPARPSRVFYYVSTPPGPPGPLRVADVPSGGGRDEYGVSWQPAPSGRAYQPVVGVYQRGPLGLFGHASYIVGLAHDQQLSLDWTSAAKLTSP